MNELFDMDKMRSRFLTFIVLAAGFTTLVVFGTYAFTYSIDTVLKVGLLWALLAGIAGAAWVTFGSIRR